MAEQTGITLDFDLHGLKQIPALLRRIERHGGNTETPLKKWGIFMLSQTAKTFQKEGRADVDWEPLAEMTKIMRAYRKRGSGRTGPKKALQDTAHLKRSVKTVTFSQRGQKAQAIFTRVPYAKTHQEGGKITIPAHTIRAKKAKALQFTIGGETFYRKSVHIPEKTYDVPARPFLFISRSDKAKALSLVRAHAKDTVKKAKKK